MTSFGALVFSFVIALLAADTSAFVANPASMLKQSSPARTLSYRTSYNLRMRRSVGALRMGDESGMDAAEAKAKRLTDQAAALREAAAGSEAEIRPPGADVDAGTSKDEAKADLRPEDMPPPQKISDDMKNRLKQELTSQGADPNKSAGNPILIVAAVIGLLVIVGGQGIFY